MLADLIDSILEFKTRMNFKGLDFAWDNPRLYNAVNPRLYNEIRVLMAKVYHRDQTLFGPVEITREVTEDANDEEKKEIKAQIKLQRTYM